jgi:hypothetical protein
MSDDLPGHELVRSLLDTQEGAAHPRLSDREAARLRNVDRIARQLLLARPEDREKLMEELAEALWPQEEQG